MRTHPCSRSRLRGGPAAALVLALFTPLAACSGEAGDGTGAMPTHGSGEPTLGPDGMPLAPGPGSSTPALPGAPSSPGADPSSPTPGVSGAPATPDPTAPDLPGAPAAPGLPAECADASPSVGSSVLRRLGRLELQLSLQELLQLDSPPDVALVPEDPKYENFRTLASLQSVSPQHLRAYVDVAEGLARDLLADADRTSRVVGCELDTEGCLADFTARFGRLAYRRALEDAEVTELTTRATEFAESPEDEFAFVIGALFTSPSFIFRTEIGDTPDGPSTLSSAELASKLSFSILGRTPDDALLGRGESGEFDTPEGLAAAARELVDDPRAQQYFDAFFEQWLDFEEPRPPPTPPEGWTEALLSEASAETELLLRDFAWGGEDFLGALTASYTYAGPALASFQSLPGTGASPPARIELPREHPRYGTGLLTHAALIAAKGDGDLIAHRGNWLFSTFLCADLALPAGLLDSLGDELEGLTRMQMLEKRKDDTRCSGCHQIIDPIGVGFAQFDSAGRFDESVSLADYPITPVLAGSDPGEFGSIAELATLLAARAEVPSCISERVFLYTQGREPESADACGQGRVTEAFGASQYDFRELLVAMVSAPEFRLRTPAEPTDADPPAETTGAE